MAGLNQAPRQSHLVKSRPVLVVDDEPRVLATLGRWLQEDGWHTVCVSSASEAIQAAESRDFCLAVIDYRLKNRSQGIELGETLRRARGLAFVIISGFLNTSVIVEAMRAGAVDVIDKPTTQTKFVKLIASSAATLASSDHVTTTIGSGPMSPNDERVSTALTGSVGNRWARIVLKACESVEDPRTVPLWARSSGVSTATVEETCRLCRVTAHDSRDLGRFLRALALSRKTGVLLRDHLAVADERTLASLFQKARVSRDASYVPLDAFLPHQLFVPSSAACLRELAHLAANSRFFFAI